MRIHLFQVNSSNENSMSNHRRPYLGEKRNLWIAEMAMNKFFPF